MDFSDPKTTWKLTARRQQREAVFLVRLHPVQEAGKESLQEDQSGSLGKSLNRTEAPKALLAVLGLCQSGGTRSRSPLHPNETAPTLTAATNPNSVSEHQLQRLYQAQRWHRAAAGTEYRFRCLGHPWSGEDQIPGSAELIIDVLCVS